MGIFDRFRPESGEAGPPAAPPQTQQDGVLSTVYLEVLSGCMGVARLRQQRFGQWLADRSWNVDFQKGEIAFGGQPFPIDFLGTESHQDGTWMWGASNINGFPEAVVEPVRAFFHGELARSLPEISQETFPLRELVDGHAIASIYAVSQQEPACYYRCPYEGGAAFVAVRHLPEHLYETAQAPELLRTIRELISALPLDHRALVGGLLDEHCTDVEFDGWTLRARVSGGVNSIVVTFDQMGRIRAMDTQAGGGA